MTTAHAKQMTLFFPRILLLWAVSFVLSSCQREVTDTTLPIAHNESFDIWPDSIDLHNGVILRVVSDSMMLIRVNGNILDTIYAGHPTENRMEFRSDYPIFDFLYRREAAIPSEGRYTVNAPFDIYLNPIQNDSAPRMLDSRIRHGVVIPIDVSQLSWPTVNYNAEWLLAASEYAVASGDDRRIETTGRILLTALASDRHVASNLFNGLFTGLPRYMAADPASYPPGSGVAELSQIATAGVNIPYAIASASLGQPADSLVEAIKYNLWSPQAGGISAALYGLPPVALSYPATDNLAQNIAVISGILPRPMAEAIVAKTPVTRHGISLYTPSLRAQEAGNSYGRISPLLVQTVRTIAAAECQNEAAYAASLASLFAAEGDRLLSSRDRLPAFRSTFTSLILRGLAGMRFTPEGISFRPYVPESLPGEKQIQSLRYADATLDITITGTGHVISTFTIDGDPTEPFLPVSVTGHHKIGITLAGPTADPGEANIREKIPVIPALPGVRWPACDRPELSLPPDGGGRIAVYTDGVLTGVIPPDGVAGLSLADDRAIQFATVNDNEIYGFASAPHITIPDDRRYILKAVDFARGGTKILEDKKLAATFVEMNRFRNRRVEFDFNAPAEGIYLIDIRYASGMGIVNTQRKTALRILDVNRKEAGVFIFPQLSPSTAPKGSDDSWQKMTAWSNVVAVRLQAGTNALRLRYYQPSPVLTDPNTNTILIDRIRILPLKTDNLTK